MASGNKQENDWLEREHKGLQKIMNTSRPEGFSSNESNTRMLRTRAILVSPPVVPSDMTQSHWIDKID